MADSILILDDIRLRSLIENPEARKQFPFMATASAKAAEANAVASCCRGKKKRANAGTNFNELRRSIGNLDKNRLRILKQLLGNPKQVRVHYSNGRGRTVKLTF